MVAKKKTAEPKHFFDPLVEDVVASIVVDSEFATAKNVQAKELSDYESAVDMLEGLRTQKNYEWMSDYDTHDLAAIILTEASQWAAQYFQSRDFVEVRLEADVPNGAEKCRAAKNAINKTLNIREIYHYPKYIRGRLINSLASVVYGVEWWEKEFQEVPVGETYVPDEKNPDALPILQTKYEKKLVKDHYNYEIVDPANVFTDNGYAYNVQDKDFIIFRSEKNIEDLIASAETMGYINLDVISEWGKNPSGETESYRETVNKTDSKQRPHKTPLTKVDVLERYGKIWAVVKERLEDGYPSVIEPGYDASGEKRKDAELIEAVVAFAVQGNRRVLIRFQPQRNRDPWGRPYRPILRGLCYIHPRKDYGLSDGKYLADHQVAVNDVINMGFDRTKLATIPMFKVRKSAALDNPTLYVEPEHMIELDDPMTDLQELKISDDIQGSLAQANMWFSKMNQIASVYPPELGGVPSRASTKATAIVAAETHSSVRANYKSLTYEYTFLLDQYTHILWMIHQYAEPETAISLMGLEGAAYFDPKADYTYTPVTSNIEQAHSKQAKLQAYDQMLGRLAAFKDNPKIYKTINKILRNMMILLGDEFIDFKDSLLDESPPTGQPGQPAITAPKDMEPQPTSNQYGIPQAGPEVLARGTFEGSR